MKKKICVGVFYDKVNDKVKTFKVDGNQTAKFMKQYLIRQIELNNLSYDNYIWVGKFFTEADFEVQNADIKF